MIIIKNIKKEYRALRGEPVGALEDVSFEVGDGEFVSIVGPSGCGKTTLLRIVSGLLSKSSGEIVLDGSPVNGPRRDIGIVFQNPVLLPWRNVLENALLPIEVQHLNKKKYLKKAEELLKLVKLDGFADKYPYELSGGMQQRNALVRALINDPKILMMDEPFGALDAMTREMMNLELMRIWHVEKKTILFVTHSIPEAVFLADRVIIMAPRPSRVIDIVKIELPRPRDLNMMGLPEFSRSVRQIRTLLAENDGTEQKEGGYASQTTEL